MRYFLLSEWVFEAGDWFVDINRTLWHILRVAPDWMVTYSTYSGDYIIHEHMSRLNYRFVEYAGSDPVETWPLPPEP